VFLVTESCLFSITDVYCLLMSVSNETDLTLCHVCSADRHVGQKTWFKEVRPARQIIVSMQWLCVPTVDSWGLFSCLLTAGVVPYITRRAV